MMPNIDRYEAERDRETREARLALREARDKLGPQASLKSVIWHLLQEAVETLGRLPDKERTWLLSSERVIWPELDRPSEENRLVEWEIGIHVAMGNRDSDSVKLRFPVTDPTAPRRMFTALGWLRHVHGKRPKRDRDVVLALAGKVPFQRVRSLMGGNVTDFAILAVKGKVLKQIEVALRARGLA